MVASVVCVVVCHFFECLTSIIESQASAPAISLLNNYAATAPTLPDSKLSNSKQPEEKHPNITIIWLKLYILSISKMDEFTLFPIVKETDYFVVLNQV